MKRSNKFWRKNEKEVMERLGLTPTKNSGSGWVEKGDGQNENVICELKSTDALSYRLRLEDLLQIEHHAVVANKMPVFAVQFLRDDDIYFIIRPEMLSDIAKYIDTGECNIDNAPLIQFNDNMGDNTINIVPKTIVGGSARSVRASFDREREKKYSKERSAT